MPSVESMPTAAMPTPNTPSRKVSPPPAATKETRIATTTVISGIQVDFMPSAMPEMITVAGPIWACSAIRWVGRVLVGGVLLGTPGDHEAGQETDHDRDPESPPDDARLLSSGLPSANQSRPARAEHDQAGTRPDTPWRLFRSWASEAPSFVRTTKIERIEADDAEARQGRRHGHQSKAFRVAEPGWTAAAAARAMAARTEP